MVTETEKLPWLSVDERQQQRDAKKEAVLLAAARLFTSHGFHGTSLDDIARSLGVTKPTIYHYIENKEQILFLCVRRGLAALRASLCEAEQRGLAGRARLRAAMENYARIVTSEFGLCVIRVGEDPLNERRRRELRDLKGEIDAEFRALIEEGMAQGWIARGDARMATYTVVAALSSIGRWYQPQLHTERNLQDAVRHCVEMLMRGVLSEATGVAGFSADTQGDDSMFRTRRETHFDGRVVRCFTPRPGSVAQMLEAAVAARADAAALVAGDTRLSWRELRHAAARCANGLAQRGVAPGERVGIFLGNSPEFVIAVLACAWLGAVAVPVSTRAGREELAYSLNDAGAVALVCGEELQAQVPAEAALPDLRARFACGAAQPGFEPFVALMQAEPLAQATPVREEDLAVLLYTSGTTGRPKGAMLSHLNIVHSAMHFAQAMALTAADRTLVAVPLSHVTGLVAQLFTMLHCHGCTVLMEHFKAADFVRLAAAERTTHTVMVPAMYNLCLLLPDLERYDLAQWRVGAYGGAPMPVATIDAVADRLPTVTLMNAYGATETCSPATIMPAGMTAAHRDSVGRVVACGEICIVDEAGNEVPRGEVGEIWIGGPMVVPGYWRNAEATAREFVGGFWRSGDVGSMDDEGYVRILDRKKDVINRGGYKIFCAQVEGALADHPQVIESALVGVPCPVLGERVHAFVCVRELDEATQASALRAFLAPRMADYAVPETWTIGTDPLPRNLNGKLMKRALRESLHVALT